MHSVQCKALKKKNDFRSARCQALAYINKMLICHSAVSSLERWARLTYSKINDIESI